MRTSISGKKLGTTSLLVVLILWGLLSTKYHPLLLPSPLETLKALINMSRTGVLWVNILITLRRTVYGYGLALLVGGSLALVLKWSPFWQAVMRPVVTIIQIIPPVIWMVLAVLWFGIADDLTPVFLIFIVTFPITFVNIFGGLDSINLELVEMAQVYQVSQKKIVTEVYLPALIPHLAACISVGISFAWKSTIFAEFMGSSSGVGFALSMANANLETDKLFAWAVILVVLMLICEYGILQPIQRKVMRWSA